MSLVEILKLTFSTIWAHKLRSFLTLLGIIIGITGFMVILSLIQGFNAYIDEKIAKIGSNSFSISQFGIDDYKEKTYATALRRNKELTMDELNFIKERTQLVDKIGAKAGGEIATIKNENKTVENVSVSGTEPIISDIDNLDIAEGRYFTDAENNNAVRVAYIGADIANNLFPSDSALDKEIKIHGFSYRVIGIQTAQGTVFGRPMDSFAQLPLKTFSADFGGIKNTHSPSFKVKAKSDQALNDAVEEVRMLLRVKRRIPSNESDNFGIYTPDAISGIKNSLLGPTYAVALAVPTIALIVGGIVIMNIMLVSVTERTREIGIRKALGAKHSDIMQQFLFEAMMLCTIGGIIGFILAKLIGYIVTIYVFQTRMTIGSAMIAIGISAIVGIFSGILPARKASKLDPIEALRAE
jgi:putative ABC transport system permease protein